MYVRLCAPKCGQTGSTYWLKHPSSEQSVPAKMQYWLTSEHYQSETFRALKIEEVTVFKYLILGTNVNCVA